MHRHLLHQHCLYFSIYRVFRRAINRVLLYFHLDWVVKRGFPGGRRRNQGHMGEIQTVHCVNASIIVDQSSTYKHVFLPKAAG